MMKSGSLTLLLTLCGLVGSSTLAAGEPAHPAIPDSAAYLGQKHPGATPERFPLPIIPGSFSAERIAISKDGRDIYYSELDGYTEMDGQPHTVRLKRLTYADGRWAEPVTLFDSVTSPWVSLDGDTMYVQAGVKKAFISVRDGESWGPLTRVFSQLRVAHYFQTTAGGKRYISAVAAGGVGILDRCLMTVKDDSVSVTSLGLPVNEAGYNFDFVVSPDESYMILPIASQLCISYAKPDGGWTNPKSLGPAVNFGLATWGPYITYDQKYMFYTTGTKPDYSDTYTYWISLPGLVDSLRHTNFVPYAKVKLTNQTSTAGKPVTVVIPDNTFFDDDNEALTYSATLADGNSLPSWLQFDAKTRSISGTPSEKGKVAIKMVATDSAGAAASVTLEIEVV